MARQGFAHREINFKNLYVETRPSAAPRVPWLRIAPTGRMISVESEEMKEGQLLPTGKRARQWHWQKNEFSLEFSSYRFGRKFMDTRPSPSRSDPDSFYMRTALYPPAKEVQLAF